MRVTISQASVVSKPSVSSDHYYLANATTTVRNRLVNRPDGKTPASGSSDKTVKLWDSQTRQELATLKGHDDSVYSVTFSPDGKTLTSGSEDKTVKLRVGSARE